MNEVGRKSVSTSYVWLFQSLKKAENPIVLYHYAPTRSGEVPKGFLRDFKGYLHCDGYNCYDKVNDIFRVGCWAHVRRKFEEARISSFSSSQKKSLSETGLDYCNALFALERKWVKEKLSFNERYQARLKETVPLLEDLWTWTSSITSLPSSKLGKALGYLHNQKEPLMRFLEDGSCEISNNDAEQNIRPFVTGRKNWYFSNSVKGAESSAMAYSFIATAKANGLNPQKYLNYLFEHLPNTPFQENNALLEAYLPWTESIQANCK